MIMMWCESFRFLFIISFAHPYVDRMTGNGGNGHLFMVLVKPKHIRHLNRLSSLVKCHANHRKVISMCIQCLYHLLLALPLHTFWWGIRFDIGFMVLDGLIYGNNVVNRNHLNYGAHKIYNHYVLDVVYNGIM